MDAVYKYVLTQAVKVNSGNQFSKIIETVWWTGKEYALLVFSIGSVFINDFFSR